MALNARAMRGERHFKMNFLIKNKSLGKYGLMRHKKKRHYAN